MVRGVQLAKADILRFFDDLPRKIHRQRELEGVLSHHRGEWGLGQGTSFKKFVDYLLNSRKLRRMEFAFPHRKEVRYVWGTVPLEAVLITLKPNCHFSHFTAVQLHDLTEQDPRTIYLNHEQHPKPPPAMGLAQERIDLAFRRKPRTTRNVAIIRGTQRKGTRVTLLNGKHTGYLGVEDRDVQLPGEKNRIGLRLTDIERTLIDIAVRPFYAGGVGEVLSAYRNAAGRASVNRIAGMLRKLGHVYPYHQSIGFYLEAAGVFDKNTVDLFHDRFEYEFDFYLTYGMKSTEYIPRWRVHVPDGLSL